MPNEFVWVDPDDLIEQNQIAVEATGEVHFVRDRALLEMACHNPQNRQHYDGEDDPITLAVSLLTAVANAHAFEQGNKRTGFMAMQLFLLRNGLEYAGPDGVDFAEDIIDLITGQRSAEWFEDVIAEYVIEAVA